MSDGEMIKIGGISFRPEQVKQVNRDEYGSYSVEMDDGCIFTFDEQSAKQQVKSPSIFRDDSGTTWVEYCKLNTLQDSPKTVNHFFLSDTDVWFGGTIGKEDRLIQSNTPKHEGPVPMSINFFSQHE